MSRDNVQIIERIKWLMQNSRRNQAQFGKLLGVDASNLSKILAGRLNLSEGFINRVVVNCGVDKEWLTEGNGVPYPRNASQPVRISHGETAMTAPARPQGAPVYNIDVTAGCMPLSRMFTDERIIGYLNLPDVNPEYPVVRVTGDSMYPKMKDGAFISIRPISLRSPISWGQVYVVILEDYRFVKFIRRHPDSRYVILHSANPEYDDMEIERDSILGLYLVEAVFDYDIIS